MQLPPLGYTITPLVGISSFFSSIKYILSIKYLCPATMKCWHGLPWTTILWFWCRLKVLVTFCILCRLGCELKLWVKNSLCVGHVNLCFITSWEETVIGLLTYNTNLIYAWIEKYTDVHICRISRNLFVSRKRRK